MVIMCITAGSSYAMVTTEPLSAPMDKVPVWVLRAKTTPLTAYWSEGEDIVAVGSAPRMLFS